MAYLGDIRENSIGPNGELWEGDNRIEQRHYWNGAYIDLCDLPAEDYAKTIFVTNGSASSDDDITIPIKKITIEIVDGDIVVTYSGAIVSDMYVSVSYNNGESKTMMLRAGTNGGSGVSFGLRNVTSVEGYGIGATETDAVNEKKKFQDDEFKYEIDYIAPIVYPMAYHLALMKGDILYLSDDELMARLEYGENIPMLNADGSEIFTASIEPLPVEGLAEMNPAQITNELLANSQDIVITSDKPIVDILAASTNDSVIEGWHKRDTKITVDGVAYEIWYKTANDTELSAIYDPVVTDAVISVPKDSITYIIKYK